MTSASRRLLAPPMYLLQKQPLHTNSAIFQKTESFSGIYIYINQRIHSDSGLPPQISNEFKTISKDFTTQTVI
jgi:hypothetical protein